MTLISRVLGLLRDHYQAVFFGTGPVAAAWEISFMLPNMLRNLLAEGVLSQAFIPIYSEAWKKSEEEAKRVAGIILGFLFFVLLAVVVIGITIFPYILPVYTHKSEGESELLIYLSRVMFVFILTVSLTAILSGMANTHQHFTVPAVSPIILNLVFISNFWILIPFHFAAEANARYLAWGVVVGGFVQLGTQIYYVKKKGWWPQLTIVWNDPALRKIFSLMAPAVLGASIFQLNQLMDIALASYLIKDVGAVPALRYAHRLIQLPTGIIGVALSTAILPTLVHSIRNDRNQENGEELIKAMNFALFLTAPAGIGLYMLGPDIINLLFYGGAWNLDSTAQTWKALQFYCMGVPFYSINKILTSSFYAYQDTKTPVSIMVRIVGLNFVMNLALIPFFAQGGLALSTSITSLLNTVYLTYKLREKMPLMPFGILINSLKKQALLFLGLIVFLLLISSFLRPLADAAGAKIARLLDPSNAPRYAAGVIVLIGGAGGALLYLGAGFALRLSELDVFRGLLNRKK